MNSPWNIFEQFSHILTLILAANTYKIPTVLGSSREGHIRSAPAFSLTGKLKKKLPEGVKFPAPGAYDAR